MINLALDTNILHQEGLASGRMQILQKLAEDNLVKVYIPEIVKREFITKRTHAIKESLEKATSNLKGAHKKLDTNSESKLKSIH